MAEDAYVKEVVSFLALVWYRWTHYLSGFVIWFVSLLFVYSLYLIGKHAKKIADILQRMDICVTNAHMIADLTKRCVADEARLAQRLVRCQEREDKNVAAVVSMVQRIEWCEQREDLCVAVVAKKHKEITEGTEPPNALLCPISLELMLEPVIDANGHTFERINIETCLKNRPGMSPYTNLPYHLGEARLTNNFALLDIAGSFDRKRKIELKIKTQIDLST